MVSVFVVVVVVVVFSFDDPFAFFKTRIVKGLFVLEFRIIDRFRSFDKFDSFTDGRDIIFFPLSRLLQPITLALLMH